MRNGHFTTARRLTARASQEARRVRRKNDPDSAREAAGKGWLGACADLYGLLEARGIPAEQFPKNQKARIFYLRELLQRARMLADRRSRS